MLENPEPTHKFFLGYGIDLICIFILGCIGFILPGQIFDDYDALYSQYPARNYNLTFINPLNTSKIISSSIYVLNPFHTRNYEFNTAVTGDDLLILAGPLPIIYVIILQIIIFYFLCKWNKKYLYFDFISFSYSYCISLGLTFWFTRLIKLFCSFNRPDYWQRCNPEFNFEYKYNEFFELTSTFMNLIKCDPFEIGLDEKDLAKGSKSFISGHTSYTFSVSILLLWWSYGKLNHPYFNKIFSIKFKYTSLFGKIFGNKIENKIEKTIYYIIDYTLLIELIFCTWPLWGSTLVAISRIDDHRHFVSDLIAGGLLGIATGTFGFLAQYNFYQPFSNRVLKLMKYDYQEKTKKQKNQHKK